MAGEGKHDVKQGREEYCAAGSVDGVIGLQMEVLLNQIVINFLAEVDVLCVEDIFLN